MKIWLINGYTQEIGIWEVELFTSKKDAEWMFNHYVEDYKATISDDNEWFAQCDDGIGRFYLEERFIDIN